jgi:plasmid maintenance system antidote protein VapI
MDFLNQTSYQEILKNELELRCGHNPQYSLRAFARDLNLAAPRLSEIFAKKQGLSVGLASRIADTLKFDKDKKNYFCRRRWY